MEVNQLVAHYKANYERKVFMTRLSHAMQNAYLMYIYDLTMKSDASDLHRSYHLWRLSEQ